MNRTSTTTRDGSTTISGAVLAMAAPLAALTGGLWWFAATFTFAVEGAGRGMHRDAALGLGVTAAGVLVLGTLAWWGFRAPGWSLATVLLAVGVLAFACWHELDIASTAAPGGDDDPLGVGALWLLLACPLSWPLVVSTIAAGARGLRGRSAPTPRPQPGR